MIGHDFPYLDTRDLNLDWLLRTMKALVEKWENFTPEIQGFVNDWLDAHPEATTTVQDGSLTAPKFTETLKLQTIKDYVTPQMFGAKADGSTNDSAAIQLAIDSKKPVFFPKGTYYIEDTVVLSGVYNTWIDASNAVINYIGSDSALKITHSDNFDLKLGYVNAPHGNCIYFYSDDPASHVQYTNIYFHKLNALNDCIKAESYLTGWLNEIRIHDGQLEGGSNGIHLINHSAINSMNQWHFYNVGVEGVTTGFFFETDENCYMGEIFTVGLRYKESFTYIYKSNGNVTNLAHISPIPFVENFISIIGGLNSTWIIFSPSSSNDNAVGDMGFVYYNTFSVLQTRYYSLYNTIPLASGTDLNQIGQGRFSANDFAVAGTIVNAPVSVPFEVLTESVLGTNYLRQTLKVYNSNDTYTRVSNLDKTIWSAWAKFIIGEKSNITYINITDTSESGYTFPDDGYLSLLATNTGAYASGTLYGSTGSTGINLYCSYEGQRNTVVYVKKGMKFTKIESSANSGIFFYQLT